MNSGPHIVVVGAGAFGGWTALSLQRQKTEGRVTLIDAWGPGHPKSSSGGETRIIRTAYGTRTVYSRLAAQAMQRWRDHDMQWNAGLIQRTGVLWMNGRLDHFAKASHAALRDMGVAVEWWAPKDIARRYPDIGLDGLTSALFEPDAGYLQASRACVHVADRFVAEGGTYLAGAAASPVRITERGRALQVHAGVPVTADVFVFACGAWLGSLFPELLGSRIRSTRQEVAYFDPPVGDRSFDAANLPAWFELSDRVMFGLPANSRHAFKIADDTSGEPFDPATGDRSGTSWFIAAMRDYMRRRFPRMADAPYVATEVCQYEGTPDSDFIIDRHPGADNVWIAGGGSGHGFKFGPVIGSMLADAILRDAPIDPMFKLARFSVETKPSEKWK
jgi:sarcosine oxidase